MHVNQKTSEIAFPAGCITICYDPTSNSQTRFLATLPSDSGKLKAITSVAYAPNSKRLASAESGHQPSIFIWNMDNNTLSHELKSHSLGVATMAFTPNSKLLISVGTEHDQQLNVWDLKSNTPLKGCKITSKIHAVSVSEDGSWFVTVGLRHCRIWNLDLSGHTITCGSYKNHEFVDVACGKGDYTNSVYAVSREGMLFVIDAKSRSLSHQIDLKAAANAVTIVGDHILVACTRSVVRVFRLADLEYVATLPKPNPIGREFATAQEAASQTQSLGSSISDSGSNSVYPDAVAVQPLPGGKRVACFYNNRALYIWDISQWKQVGKYRSFLTHSSCIWDLAIIPSSSSSSSTANTAIGGGTPIPPNSFATCSADGSIRIWNTDIGGKNVYCKELVASLSLIQAEEVYQGVVKAGPVAGLGGSLVGSASTTMGLSAGIRAICISPDGQDIASGDRSGNIRVHRLSDFSLISLQEAHESEVLRLTYNPKTNSLHDGKMLLATGSRDRLIHVFARTSTEEGGVSAPFRKANVQGDVSYQLVSTMDDHSASITGLAFADNGKDFFSASADKSVIMRHISPDGQVIKRYQNIILHNAMLDIVTVPFKQWIVTAGQDRKIYVYDSSTGSLLRTFSTLSEADILKIELDQSGLLLATASQDRIVRLYNFATGELLATAAGHSELITGVRFSQTGSHLISVSGDGCIFVWAVASELVAAMKSKLRQQRHRESLGTSTPQSPSNPGSLKSNQKAPSSRGASPSPPASGKKATIHASVLLERIISPAYHPSWANSPSQPTNPVLSPSGFWASRVPRDGIKIGTGAEYSKAHGPLLLGSPNDPRPKLSANNPDEIRSVSRTLTSSRPLARPSAAAATPTASTEAIIYFPSDANESTDIGPVVRLNAPELGQSNSSIQDDVLAEDPSRFFESLQAAEPTDFLHQQNFGNLNDSFVPTKSTNQGRKSISARYFLKRPTTPSIEVEAANSASSPSRTPSLKDGSDLDRKEQMAREVERTKARLRELGYGNFGTKPSPAPKHARSVLSTAVAPSSTAALGQDLALAAPPKSPVKPPQSPQGLSKSLGDLPTLLPPMDDEALSLAHVPINSSVTPDEAYDEAEEAEEYLEAAEAKQARPAFLESLVNGFDRTVDLYKDLRESQQQDEMVLQLRSAFAEMKATLDILCSEDQVLYSMASDRTYELTGSTTLESTEASMLERYSELLVNMVHLKLESNQNRQ
jgi:WD40 repeat protein